jgi:hypothetical protein
MKTATSIPSSALVIFCAAVLTGCSSEPTYSRAKGDGTIECRIKQGGEITPVTIVFSNQGRQALVEWKGRGALVEFDGSFLLTDYYRGDDVELSIDPEVRVTDKARKIGGLCQ